MRNINGTPNSDDVTGTDEAELAYLGAGNDVMSGGGGNDEIYGEGGRDRLSGDSGNDGIWGGSEDDSIEGNAGDDRLYGDAGNDDLIGGAGADTIEGGDGRDYIYGDDTAFGTTIPGNDRLSGGRGDDVIFGGNGNDAIVGGDGDDRLEGGRGADVIDGGAGNDYLDHDLYPDPNAQPNSPETDILRAGEGDDVLSGGLGDTIDGGDGTDRASVTFEGSTTGVDLDLRRLSAQGTIVVNDTTITSIEYVSEVRLTSYADTLIANQTSDGVNIRAGDGGDYIAGSLGFDTIRGGDGNDLIFGDLSSGYEGGLGRDWIYGENGDDLIQAGSIGASISGDDGNDQIFGAMGNDWLSGGSGDDRIGGGGGDDELYTGLGSDILVLSSRGFGRDIVGDFDRGDRIDVSALGIDSFTALLPWISAYSDRSVVTDQNSRIALRYDGQLESLVLTGRTPSSLTAADFVFDTNSTRLFNGTGGEDVLFGGAGGSSVSGFAGNDVIHGGAGDDAIDGGVGYDIATFTGTRAASRIGTISGATTITSADGTDTLRNVEALQFADGTVELTDTDPLVDDLYYYQNNPDVFAAGVDADAHYRQYGWREGRDPNAFFDTTGYLAANSDVRAAGIDPLAHYDAAGWREGRDASADFDTGLYLAHNADVRAAGIDPLAHYIAFGRGEGRQAHDAIGGVIAADGFDAEFYLLANPDVARAASAAGGDTAAFAAAHYESNGWREGRDPNAWFDSSGYLAAYGDVRAAGVDPLDHYHQYGWREGRDPSAGFDTSSYLAANGDVRAAGIDPLLHYLQYGAMELRGTFGDGVIGA